MKCHRLKVTRFPKVTFRGARSSPEWDPEEDVVSGDYGDSEPVELHSARGWHRDSPRVFLEVSIGGWPAGRMVFELRKDVAPRTAENFRCFCTGERGRDPLGRDLCYEGKMFKACIPDHAVIGVFLPNRDALPSIYSDLFEDENFILRHSRAGLLSMVSVGPDSNGSVFLITFVRSRQLDDKQVVFGELIDGWDTLDEIEKAGSVTGVPLRPITIDRCGPVWRGPALLSFQYYK